MRTKKLFMVSASLLAALCLGSCSQEVEELSASLATSRQATVTVTLPQGGTNTRTTLSQNGDGLKVVWSKNDALSVYKNVSAPETFTLVGEGGDTTGTFTGEIPDSWSDGDNITMQYPAINGSTLIDWSSQDGTLDGFFSFDWIIVDAQLEGGNLQVNEVKHKASFLHFDGFKVFSSGSDAVTLTFSNVICKYTADGPVAGDIVVNTQLSEGKLSDVYVAFGYDGKNTPMLTVTKGSTQKVFSLDRSAGFEAGKMYNLTSSSTPKEVKVGWFIGANGKFYHYRQNAIDDGTVAEAVVVYLGNKSDCTHGLAIALEDVGDNPWFYNWEDAKEEVNTWASNHKVDGGTWRMPSADDFKYIFQGCGGTAYNATLNESNTYDTKLNSLLNNQFDLTLGRYWTATEADSDHAWAFNFNTSKFLKETKDKILVSSQPATRAVLAF